MVSNEIVTYIKNQLNAGFSEDEIRAALRDQGWPENEINEAFNVTRGFAPSAPKTLKEEKIGKATAGFVLSFLGGMLIFINSILARFLPSVIDSLSQLDIFRIIGNDFFVNSLGIADTLWLFGIALGVIVIISSILIYKPGKERIGGIVVLIVSLISLVSISGFFAGSMFGIIGGILAMAKK